MSDVYLRQNSESNYKMTVESISYPKITVPAENFFPAYMEKVILAKEAIRYGTVSTINPLPKIAKQHSRSLTL